MTWSTRSGGPRCLTPGERALFSRVVLEILNELDGATYGDPPIDVPFNEIPVPQKAPVMLETCKVRAR